MAQSEEDKELKLLFIQEELQKFSEELQKRFIDAVKRKKLVDSGELLQSFGHDVDRQQDNSRARFCFAKHGRYVDINAYKHNLTSNVDLWGVKENRQSRSNRKKWYARNMYGGLDYLTRRIMYGLSDTEIERLKQIIQENNK